MAEALLAGLVKGGRVTAGNLYVTDLRPGRLEHLQQQLGVCALGNNVELAKIVDIIVIAVKPPVVEKATRELGSIGDGRTVVSIVAGTTTARLESIFDKPVPVVRVMPNTPALVGEGASALCTGSYAGPGDMNRAMAIFSSVGRAVEVPESLMDAVTGLSGSGPAYMFSIMESLIDGGLRMGLPRDVATLLVAQTMLGAAKMVLETGSHPASLKDMVTTPGGTTIEGLFVLEDQGLGGTLMKAVEKATVRSRELMAGIK